jgi:phage FluMu protein gp41
MARIKGQFRHGLKLGKEFCMDFELHDHLTAGQIITAKEQSEKVVAMEVDGRRVPVVVESPAKLGALILCQQIAHIGPIAGPLDYELFATLHQDDLDILNLYADLAAGALTTKEVSDKMLDLAQKASPEVTQRGRDVSPGADTGDSGTGDGAQGGKNQRDSGIEEGAA